jgi:hypothetical protein
MLGATLALAQSDLSDEDARERLHEIAKSSEFGAEGVVQELEQRKDNYVHDSYLGDRAYRLAKAVMTGGAVESQDPERRDQFRLEEELGRLPLGVAFERLASLVPDLNTWQRAVEDEELAMHVPQMKRLEKVVGPDAFGSSGVARSHIAQAVATAYLSILAGDADQGDLDTPYFVIAKRPSTTELIDRRKPSA